MASARESDENQSTSEEDERGDQNGRDESEPSPPFEQGWRWPLIILVISIVAMGAFGTLVAPEPPPPPPPPPAPAPPPPPPPAPGGAVTFPGT